MAAIFISHSNADNAVVADLARALQQRGFLSLFLDFDPEKGIPGGRNWEQELYLQLRNCQAVIVLCSADAMASDWVFAEITHARALGKPVIPVRISPCTPRSILQDVQVIDLEAGEDTGYERLWRALGKAGLDPEDKTLWQGTRSPYPGLTAFREEDAAVFCGRDDDIRAGLDILNQIRRFGGGRLALFLGPSGSGKSSLVRAGIVPRLRRNPDWLVLEPFRPRGQPFDELTSVLIHAYDERDHRQIPASLHAALGNGEPDSLLQITADLARTAGQPEASVVLVIDQLEELLDPENRQDVGRFLAMLARSLSDATGHLIVIGTMRSDFLENFQSHPVLRELPFRDVPVRPLSIREFAQVIATPARVAGIELEAGLVERMIADTATGDALPLLAFALRELWEQYGQDGHISIKDYTQLGGLEGSIHRAAEGVLNSARPDTAGIQGLKNAFRRMVRINDEGQYVRRLTHWQELPESSHPILRHFVDARLLVSGKDENQVEVAHEALFRAWPTLKGWLDQDREFLLWRRRLQTALVEWENPDLIAPLRDAPLTEAERWFRERSSDLSERERDLIVQSLALRDRERATVRRRRRRVIAGLAAGLMLVTVLSVVSVWQWQTAVSNETAALEQLARTYWLSGVHNRDDQGDWLRASHYFARSADVLKGQPRGHSASLAASLLSGLVRLARVINPAVPFDGVAVSPDLEQLLTWDSEDQASLWTASDVSPILLPHTGIRGAVFDGADRLMTWGGQGGVRLWDASSGSLLAQLRHEQPVRGARLSPDSTRILSWDDAGNVLIWDAAQQKITARYQHSKRVNGAIFSADSRGVLSWSNDKTLRFLDLAMQIGPLIFDHPSAVRGAAFSADGNRLLSWDAAGRARLWNSRTQALLLPMVANSGAPIDGALFLPDAGRIITWDGQGDLEIWNLASGEASPAFSHGASLHKVLISPAGGHIFSCGDDGTVKIWNQSGDRQRTLRHKAAVLGAQFSRDATRLLSWSADQSVRLWDIQNGQLLNFPLVHADSVSGAVFSRDESRLATWSTGDGVRLWYLRPLHSTTRQLKHSARILDLKLAADGQTLRTLTADGHVDQWNTAGTAPASRTTLAGTVDAPVQDGRIAHSRSRVAGWNGRDIRIWSVEDGALDTRIDYGGDDANLMEVRLGANGAQILGWSNDGFARVWDTTNGHEIASLPHGAPVLQALVSPDGNHAITAGADFKIRFWQLPQNQLIQSVDFAGVRQIATSQDSQRGLAVSSDGRIQIRELATGIAVHELRHGPQARGARFSPDGHSIVSWDKAGLIRLWNTETGEERVAPMQHGPRMQDAVFSPDGTRLLSRSAAYVRIWDTRNGYALSPQLLHDETIVGATQAASIAVVWGIHTARIWQLPRDRSQPVTLQALEQEVVSGTTLSASGEIHILDDSQWRQRKYLLETDTGSLDH